MNKALDIGALVVTVAGIMVMVRPGSQGPTIVANFFNGFANLLTAGTGSGVPKSMTATPWK